MERLMNDSPCKYCNKNRQEDDSYPWIMPCYNCQERSEWITKQLICLSLIKDILGDDYDLDRLRELVEADREGRCEVLPCKIGSLVYSHARKLDGKDYVKETEFWWSDIPQIGKTVFLTREAAEEALRRKQNE